MEWKEILDLKSEVILKRLKKSQQQSSIDGYWIKARRVVISVVG